MIKQYVWQLTGPEVLMTILLKDAEPTDCILRTKLKLMGRGGIVNEEVSRRSLTNKPGLGMSKLFWA